MLRSTSLLGLLGQRVVTSESELQYLYVPVCIYCMIYVPLKGPSAFSIYFYNVNQNPKSPKTNFLCETMRFACLTE